MGKRFSQSSVPTQLGATIASPGSGVWAPSEDFVQIACVGRGHIRERSLGESSSILHPASILCRPTQARILTCGSEDPASVDVTDLAERRQRTQVPPARLLRCSAALKAGGTETAPRLRSSAPTPTRRFHVTDTPLTRRSRPAAPDPGQSRTKVPFGQFFACSFPWRWFGSFMPSHEQRPLMCSVGALRCHKQKHVCVCV